MCSDACRPEATGVKKKNGMCSDACCPEATGVVVVYDGNRWIAKTSERIHVKLRDEASLRRGEL
jgi:hypothetical protein